MEFLRLTSLAPSVSEEVLLQTRPISQGGGGGGEGGRGGGGGVAG